MFDEKSDFPQAKEELLDPTQAGPKKEGRVTKAENLKMMMAKARDERSDRILSLQSTHRHICEIVSIYWGVDANDIIDGVGDDIHHVKLLESLCEANGAYAIVFVKQTGPSYEISTGRYNPTTPSDSTTERYYITNGLTIPLQGKAVIAYRNNNVKGVDMRNLNDDIYFTQMDLKENIVSGIYNIMSKCITPFITKTKEWGDLTKTDIGLQAKDEFLSDYVCFVNFIDKTRIDLEEIHTTNAKSIHDPSQNYI